MNVAVNTKRRTRKRWLPMGTPRAPSPLMWFDADLVRSASFLQVEGEARPQNTRAQRNANEYHTCILKLK